MTSLRDPRRYREQAAHFRELAAATTDSRALRDHYVSLSLEYERLARILEKTAAPTVGETQQPSVYSGNGRQARSRGAHIEPEPQRKGVTTRRCGSTGGSAPTPRPTGSPHRET